VEELLAIFSLSLFEFKLILYSTVGTFIFWALVNKTLFAPHIALIERREELTEGALEKAEKLSVESHQFEEQIHSVIADTREDLNAERVAKIQQVSEQLDERISAEQLLASRRLEAGRKDLADKLAELSKDLKSSVPELVSLVQSTALARTN
jgi:F0F1-type ATP synthase membrane subunit b/b'